MGGSAAARLPRGILDVTAGMVTAVMTLAMAFSPRVPAVFIAGALFYNGMAGVVYAAFNAVGYQIVGQKTAVASTQLGLFSASTNFAIVYMTWADGQGFKHFGTRGLLLTDGLASLLAGALLLLFLGRRLARRPGAATEQISAAAGAGREE